MKMDPGTHYNLARGVAPGDLTTGDHAGASVDHALAPSASFFIDVSGVGTGGTVDAKLQYSDDDTTWTDEPNTDAGNDTAITQIDAAGNARIDVPNPRGRYSRVLVTVGTDTCVGQVTNVLGPLRSVSA
ncbi:MAG TPA: hypothetical protein VKA64_03390 [Gammaproteobacteria bacterium]|nr:hypothetical protein [Gammaproteobacteria bacterium]